MAIGSKVKKSSVFSVFVLLAAVLFPFVSAESLEKPYFGLSSGYSYQQLELKGSPRVGAIFVDDRKIESNGFFIAPKFGFAIGKSKFAFEFEPRWTISFHINEIRGRDGNQSVRVGFIADTFYHLLFPAIAVVKAGSKSSQITLGAGAGLNFYDVGDNTGFQTTTIPLIAKLGIAFSIFGKTVIGLDGDFMYSVYESGNFVDKLWGFSAGLKLRHLF